jgi:superkiller protein 3
MQIKRDYSQPFFGSRRRRRVGNRMLFLYGLFMGGFLMFVSAQFSRLQLMALDVVGMAPTPTQFASTWASQGYELFLKGKLEDASTAFAQAVSQQPDNVSYLYEYGRMLIELNRPAEPDKGRPKADVDMALELGDHAIEVAPNDPRSYALKAKALVWKDDSATAIPVALTGLELDASFAPLYAVLARAYTDIGRYQQGLDYGSKAVDLDPMDMDTHRSYAVTLIWVGLRQKAVEQLEDAITINPNLTSPYFELAIQYIALGKYEQAVATYEKILSLEPRNARALLRLCEAYTQVGQLSQAQGYCEDALAINPDYPQAHRQLGMVKYRRRNYEGAIEEFNQCVKLGSSEIECYYLRGLANYYLGNCDQAWTTLEESVRRINALPVKEPILSETKEGLRLVTVSCPAYSNRALPTIEPTAVQPTPLGGVGG